MRKVLTANSQLCSCPFNGGSMNPSHQGLSSTLKVHQGQLQPSIPTLRQRWCPNSSWHHSLQ